MMCNYLTVSDRKDEDDEVDGWSKDEHKGRSVDFRMSATFRWLLSSPQRDGRFSVDGDVNSFIRDDKSST